MFQGLSSFLPRGKNGLFNVLADQYDALALDIDGTSIMNEPIHAMIGVQVLRESGVEVSTDWWFSNLGKGHDAVWDQLDAQGRRPSLPRAVFKKTCGDRYIDYISNVSPDDRASLIRPGLLDLILAFRKQGKPVVAVSGNERPVVEANIDAIGIGPHLETILSHTDVIGAGYRGKPWGDSYIVACDKIGVPTARTLAVEDSLPGCVAADNAGMDFIHITYPQASQKAHPRARYHVLDTQPLCKAVNKRKATSCVHAAKTFGIRMVSPSLRAV